MIDLIAVKSGETEEERDFGTLRVVEREGWEYLGFPSIHIFMSTLGDPFELVFTTDSLFFLLNFSVGSNVDLISIFFLFRFVYHPHPLEHVKALPCRKMKWKNRGREKGKKSQQKA